MNTGRRKNYGGCGNLKEFAPMEAVIKILLVEDSAVDAELVLLQLQRAGLKLDTQVVDTEVGFLAALAADIPMSFSPISHCQDLMA